MLKNINECICGFGSGSGYGSDDGFGDGSGSGYDVKRKFSSLI